MKTTEMRPDEAADATRERVEERPAYEPPRIEKKRSVSRATLFTSTGPAGGGGFTGQG